MRRFRSGAKDAAARHPVVFIPSLINPPDVLDLAPGQSLLRHLAAVGHDIHVLDWGTPAPDDCALDMTGHVTDRLLPLLRTLGRPPIVVGYCLGGTMAVAAAQHLAPVAVATLAAPWHFSAYPEAFRTQCRANWDTNAAMCERFGLLPIEILQSGFWALDPARTIRKYADFGLLGPDDPRRDAFLVVEDWANEGAPLTLAAGRDLLKDFYGADLPGNGLWRVYDRPVDPLALSCPSLAVVSSSDRIVPAAACPPADDRLTLHLGHVGMIVSRSAPSLLWQPLSDWLSVHGG